MTASPHKTDAVQSFVRPATTLTELTKNNAKTRKKNNFTLFYIEYIYLNLLPRMRRRGDECCSSFPCNSTEALPRNLKETHAICNSESMGSAL